MRLLSCWLCSMAWYKYLCAYKPILCTCLHNGMPGFIVHADNYVHTILTIYCQVHNKCPWALNYSPRNSTGWALGSMKGVACLMTLLQLLQLEHITRYMWGLIVIRVWFFFCWIHRSIKYNINPLQSISVTLLPPPILLIHNYYDYY